MNWHVVTTHPHREFSVEQELAQLGVDCLLFLTRTSRLVKGRLLKSLAPAFPRYLFVRLSDETKNLVSEIRGFVGFLCDAATMDPTRVPQSTVDEMLSRCDGNRVVRDEVVVAPRFSPGDRVQIIGTANALHGYVGKFEHAMSRERACVLIDWLGRSVPVEVDEACLVKVVVKAPTHRRSRRKRFRRDRHDIEGRGASLESAEKVR